MTEPLTFLIIELQHCNLGEEYRLSAANIDDSNCGRFSAKKVNAELSNVTAEITKHTSKNNGCGI